MGFGNRDQGLGFVTQSCRSRMQGSRFRVRALPAAVVAAAAAAAAPRRSPAVCPLVYAHLQRLNRTDSTSQPQESHARARGSRAASLATPSRHRPTAYTRSTPPSRAGRLSVARACVVCCERKRESALVWVCLVFMFCVLATCRVFFSWSKKQSLHPVRARRANYNLNARRVR